MCGSVQLSSSSTADAHGGDRHFAWGCWHSTQSPSTQRRGKGRGSAASHPDSHPPSVQAAGLVTVDVMLKWWQQQLSDTAAENRIICWPIGLYLKSFSLELEENDRVMTVLSAKGMAVLLLPTGYVRVISDYWKWDLCAIYIFANRMLLENIKHSLFALINDWLFC